MPNKHQSATDINLKKLVENDQTDNAPLSKKPMEKLFKSFLKNNYVPHHSFCFLFWDEAKQYTLKFDFHPQGILHSGYLSLPDSPPDLV